MRARTAHSGDDKRGNAFASAVRWCLAAIVAGAALGGGLSGLTLFLSNDSLRSFGYMEIFLLLTPLYTLLMLAFAGIGFILERLFRVSLHPARIVSLASLLLSLVYGWNYWLFHAFLRSEQRIVLLLETAAFLGIALMFLVSRRIRRNGIIPFGRSPVAILLLTLFGTGFLNGTLPSVHKQHISAESHAASEIDESFSKFENTGDPLLLFGVDGADWQILLPMIKSGKLPFLARVTREGWCSTLETFNPTSSPLIWTSIVTGKHPFQHGIRDFGIHSLRFSRQWISVLPKGAGLLKVAALAGKLGLWQFYPSTSDMVKSQPLWRISSERGISTLVGNWPVCVPVEPVSGIIVGEIEFFSYHGIEANRAFYPEPMSVLFERVQMERDLFHYQQDASSIGPDLELVMRIERETLDQWRRFHYAWSKWRPRLTMLYTHSLDMTQHIFWRFGMHDRGNTLESRYRDAYSRIESHIIKLDSQMGLFFETGHSRPTVMIVSDHGFRSLLWFEKILNRQAKRIQGVHDYAPPGILILSGDRIDPRAASTRSTIFSIAPTMLSLLGLPQARDMSGISLINQLHIKDEKQSTAVPAMIDSYERPGSAPRVTSPHESTMQAGDDIQQKLKNLGYLE